MRLFPGRKAPFPRCSRGNMNVPLQAGNKALSAVNRIRLLRKHEKTRENTRKHEEKRLFSGHEEAGFSRLQPASPARSRGKARRVQEPSHCPGNPGSEEVTY